MAFGAYSEKQERKAKWENKKSKFLRATGTILRKGLKKRKAEMFR